MQGLPNATMQSWCNAPS